MKVVSLFSGGGLGDFGFMAAGMEIAWQVEIDEFCKKILSKHWQNVPKFSDIKKPPQISQDFTQVILWRTRF